MTKPILSETGQAIADLIGEDAAYRLFQKLGGDRVYMSGKPTDCGKSYRRLVGAVGTKNAEALRQWCAGTGLDIPKELPARRLARNIKIIRDYENGIPMHEICRTYDLGRRQVFEILKKPIGITE